MLTHIIIETFSNHYTIFPLFSDGTKQKLNFIWIIEVFRLNSINAHVNINYIFVVIISQILGNITKVSPNSATLEARENGHMDRLDGRSMTARSDMFHSFTDYKWWLCRWMICIAVNICTMYMYIDNIIYIQLVCRGKMMWLSSSSNCYPYKYHLGIISIQLVVMSGNFRM